MFKLETFLKPYKKECIVGPIFKLFEAVIDIILPTIMALIINNGVEKHDMAYVLKMGGLMLLLSLIGFGCASVCQYFAARASQGFGTTLRNTMFQHISSFSHSEIDKFGTASLINRVTNDVNQLQIAVAMAIRLVVRTPFICIGSVIMAMILNFKLSIIIIITIPVFSAIIYFVIVKTSPLYTKYQKRLDKLGKILRENLSGVRVIRAFSKAEDEKKRFKGANDNLMETGIGISKTASLLNPLTSLAANFAIVAILWVGGNKINTGTLSKGVIVAFINYLTQILIVLIVISNLIIIFTKAFASAKRVNEVLDTESSINDGAVKVAGINESVPAIEFKDVSFGYNTTGDVAIENVSVKIKHGETIGIIGSTGSGKSTFVNLIPRFYDVSSGDILVDGVNVKDYNLIELRQKVGFVPQKAVLFTGTIAENIRWGKQDATDEEVKEAAETAQAYEFISKLSDGFNAPVSRGGLNFSGGQKQRLTIARGLVSHPEILVLDDSFSALDFATDAKLRKAIKENCKDTTTIIVSQRASTIKYADKIIVFDDGKVSGIGNHSELFKNCDVYREICLSQMSSEEAAK